MLAQGAAPLAEGVVLTGEVRWALAEETPQRLEDLIYRRCARPGSPRRSGIAFWPPRQRSWARPWAGLPSASAPKSSASARLAQELAFKGLALAPKAAQGAQPSRGLGV